MQVCHGNVFFLPTQAVCLPIHAAVRQHRLPMLGGVLLEAQTYWPNIDQVIGNRLNAGGLRVYLLSQYNTGVPAIRLPNVNRTKWRTIPLPYHLVTFPTRRGGRGAYLNLSLIKESCKQLTVGINKMHWNAVAIPAFPVEAQELHLWEQAQKILANSLDDRVTLVLPEMKDGTQ